MKKYGTILLAVILLAYVLFSFGCGSEAPGTNDHSDVDPASFGTLTFTANGEEFIREGFLSKDGWDLTFDQAYVTMSGITAYQTEPPYDTDQGWDIDYQVKVELDGIYTVNLALPASDPAELGEFTEVPAGHFNAISWIMVRAVEGPSAGYSLFLTGQAEKDGRVIDFTLGIEQEVAYLGGDYIGDERKGIVIPGGNAEVEMTYHFDHLFGDGEEDPDDPLNKEALGFEPLAELASSDGVFEADLASLEGALSPADFELLLSILTHFGHVGEGHCLARFID
ncbi:MAG: DUF4382 domain-containing protein [Bacillota bacterium]